MENYLLYGVSEIVFFFSVWSSPYGARRQYKGLRFSLPFRLITGALNQANKRIQLHISCGQIPEQKIRAHFEVLLDPPLVVSYYVHTPHIQSRAFFRICMLNILINHINPSSPTWTPTRTPIRTPRRAQNKSSPESDMCPWITRMEVQGILYEICDWMVRQLLI